MSVALVLPLVLSFMPAKAQTFRVAVGGFMHESNSFNAAKTVMSDFRIEDALEPWRKANDEITGYIEGLEQAGIEPVPTLYANATPKGPLSRQTYESIYARLLARIKAAGKIDGLLLGLHGAMVAEHHPHADEETVRRLRREFGPTFPLIVTHDFHANISPEIVKLSTALVTYKQNPHLDTRERGRQAASIMARLLRKQIRPVQAVAKPEMVYNIIFQNTYAEPLKSITAESIELEKKNPAILAASVSGGYQYADVPFMGPTVVVVADGDPALAEREAQRLSGLLWATREQIALNLPDAAAAVRQAMNEPKFPVTLMDTGDNIGGGSAGDSTFLLEELVRQKATGWVMTICDPAAVEAAVKAGIGGRFDLAVGGRTDAMHGKPVRVRGRVKTLSEGKYIEPETRHGGGRYFDQGLTTVIEAEGSTPDAQSLLVLNSRRTVPFSLHQLVSLGIYPERQRILVAKGTIAPRAAYEPVSAKIITVDSPGVTAVNPARFRFERLRGKLWGLGE